METRGHYAATGCEECHTIKGILPVNPKLDYLFDIFRASKAPVMTGTGSAVEKICGLPFDVSSCLRFELQQANPPRAPNALLRVPI